MSTAPAGPGVVARLLEGTELAAAEAAWAAVDARAGDPPAMVSWTWTSIWLRHFGDVVPHRFVVVEDGDGPCGVVLLCRSVQRRGPVPVRRLHVGTSGEPEGEGAYIEHNRVHCVPERRDAVHEALAAVVHEDRSWDELVVDGASEPDAAFAVARATWRPRLRVDRQTSFQYDLTAPGADDDISSALGSGARRRVRQSLKAFTARGPLELDWPDEADGALTILDELVDLHQRRWIEAGEPGVFSSERFSGFHRDLIRALVPTGHAAVVRIRCGDETVGCLYGFLDDGALLFYQSGFGVFDDNRLRAGHAAHAVFMQACRQRGLRVYDFLAGDARYKRELSTGGPDLLWCVVQRPRVRLRIVDVAREVRDRRAARAADPQ